MTNQDISQDKIDKIRNFYTYIFKNSINKNTKYSVIEDVCSFKYGKCEYRNGIYEIHICNLEMLVPENAITISELIEMTIAFCHEPVHIKQDTYKHSTIDAEKEVFLDKTANQIWRNFYEENYGDQLFELFARRESYKKAFDVLSDYFNLDDNRKDLVAKELLNHMVQYENIDNPIDNTEFVNYNEILNVIDNYYKERIIEWNNTPYRLPKTRFNGEFEILRDFDFRTKSEQLIMILDITLDPHKNIWMTEEARNNLENSFIPEFIKKQKEPEIDFLSR